MASGSRTEVISILRRFVHGQLTFDELQGFVRSHNYGWLDELLDGLQLEDRDYREIALDERALSARLRRFVDGAVSANAFADWSFETYRIFSSGSYPLSDVYSANVEIALLMLCLLTECEANGLLDSGLRRGVGARSPIAPPSRRLSGRLLESLERGQPIPAESILRRALQQCGTVRLQTRPRAIDPRGLEARGPDIRGDGFVWSAPEDLPFGEGDLSDRTSELTGLEAWAQDPELWCDLALVTTPADRPAPSAEDCWFIPLAVCTRDLWLENPPEGSWGHPENDRMHAIRERFPHLDLEELNPMYYVGPDGIAEIVLETERVDRTAQLAAIRLFCLRNRIRNCTLDGSPCYPSREDR